jgi:hypothetical protein
LKGFILNIIIAASTGVTSKVRCLFTRLSWSESQPFAADNDCAAPFPKVTGDSPSARMHLFSSFLSTFLFSDHSCFPESQRMTRVYKTLGKRLNWYRNDSWKFRTIGSALGHTAQTGEEHRSYRCHPEQSRLLPHSIWATMNLKFGLDEHEIT